MTTKSTMIKKLFCVLFSALFLLSGAVVLGGEIRVGCLRGSAGMQYSRYGGAFRSLLEQVRSETLAELEPSAVELPDFSDERLLSLPFVYANYADRESWEFSDAEASRLKVFFERGGFLFIDAGITAAFLRDIPQAGQHHSFPEWDACPELKAAFKRVFPEQSFQCLKRSDPLFKAFYSGLPSTEYLPDSVRSYVENEKWPDGTYSTAVLKTKGRVSVMTMPIIAMGWGRDTRGRWLTNIQFRVLEDTAGLTDYVKNAAYSGARFEVKREDGGADVVYCQSAAQPSWNCEPSGRTRIFKYYGSPEINDFAHVYYTRLGINILMYALTR